MHKFILPPLALFAAILFLSSPALALSIDRDSDINTDGTAKFADPDEQMPNFMTGGPPEDQATPHATPSVLLPMSPSEGGGPGMNFSVNSFGGSGGSRSDAFDQAFGNK